VVAREALAHGRPVVATRVGGLVDAVEDGVTGELVERHALRSSILRLLEDRAAREAMGSAAAAAARATLSWPLCAGALAEALRVSRMR
jgi:glycosyltransferase involved in cell wall biosynthesis